MLLADYHLVFIIICFVMLFMELYYIFIEPDKQGIIVAAILCAINWVMCLIIYMGFFGVGLPSVDYLGEISVTTYSDMYSNFILFFALHWINLILIFICWYKWMNYVHVETQD